MASKDRETGEKSGLVSFWVNVFVLGIVMVVLGFYLGTYMLEVWKSDDVGNVQDLAAAPGTDYTGGESVPTAVGSSESTVSSLSRSSGTSQQSSQPSTGQPVQSSSVPAVTGGLYKVQVGSFNSRDAAEAVAGELKRKGYSDAWVTPTVPHRVQVGAYANPDNASRIVKELESFGYTVYVVN